MKWARIQDRTVIETTDISPEGRYYPSLIWVDIPDEVDQHWIAELDGTYSPPAWYVFPVGNIGPVFSEEYLALEQSRIDFVGE